MEYWIARDKNNDLFLYEEEPIRSEVVFTPKSSLEAAGRATFYTIDFELFPEVTWLNSPQKVKIELV